jgi:hypothetical protein
MTGFDGSDVGTGTQTQGAVDPAFTQEFLNALQTATLSFWQNQSGRWLGMLQQMREGAYSFPKYLQDVVGMWDSWVSLMAFPFQSSANQTRLLPTLLFVVDGAAETAGPAGAPTSIFVPPGVTPLVTDLYQVGGNATIAANNHVRVTLSPAGDRVEVSLVDLGSGKVAREDKKVPPGYYVGAVYATEVATRRPLAVIHARIEE